jgi:di/tricarboxylate transporter
MVSLFDASGLAGAIGTTALVWLPLAPGEPAESFAALVAGASLVGLVTTHPGVPAVLGPLAAPMAEASGLPLEAVLMTEVIGFSAMLLPYQSAPVMVALQLADIRLASGTKLSLLLGGLTLLVLVPLDYVWWQWLGRLE